MALRYCFESDKVKQNLRPCQINGWVILDSIGGRVTHRSEKTDDGVVMTYCFESAYVPRTLARCKRNDLAVIDTEGHEKPSVKP